MSTEDASKVQIETMKLLTDLSNRRTEMSAYRNYMNAERTLAVWIRTALAAMIFGIALDKLDLLLYRMPAKDFSQDAVTLTHILGIALIVYSIVMALTSALRFISFCKAYQKEFPLPPAHHASLAFFYALMVVLFGVGLLVLVIMIG